MRIAELIADALPKAEASCVPDSAVKLLLSGILDCSVPELAILGDAEVTEQQYQLWQKSLLRLLDHEPAQYILGYAWFYGLCFQVNPSVLIPRPETEGLVELILPRLYPGCRVLDIGTGSGVIAITLAKLFPQADVYATDMHSGALSTARQNASLHDVNVSFHLCDLCPAGNGLWDIIVSNPPYISEDEYTTLDQEVRLHEPSEALLAGEDGLQFYRRILTIADSRLSPNGILAFEHGYGQRESIITTAQEAGYTLILAGDDLAGRDRYLLFSRQMV